MTIGIIPDDYFNKSKLDARLSRLEVASFLNQPDFTTARSFVDSSEGKFVNLTLFDISDMPDRLNNRELINYILKNIS